ncbi:MAG: hypothetical protein ACI3XQ_06035 [Eubacteriales bacterium]
MTDRYISIEWMETILNHYKNTRCWNSNVVDIDTVIRVLEVLENEIKHAPNISPRQLGNRLMKAKDAALESNLHMLDREIEESRAEYRVQESKGNATLMGFYKGMLVAREEMRGWLGRMVNDGKASD